MKSWRILPVLFLGLGCQSLCRSPSGCPAECVPCQKPAGAVSTQPGANVAASPAVPCQTSSPAAPEVSVKPAPEIHIKAPAPQIIISTPQATLPMQQPTAFQGTPAYAPGAPLLMGSPAMVAGVQGGNGIARTTTTSRDRVVLGLDWVRIPLPILRLIPIRGPQKTTTETEFDAPAAAPAMVSVQAQPAVYAYQPAPTYQPQVAMAAYAPQPMMQQAPFAMPAYQPAPQPQMVYAQPPPQPAYYAAPTPPLPPPPVMAVQPALACDPGAAPACRATVAELNQQLRAVQQKLDEVEAAKRGSSLPSINK